MHRTHELPEPVPIGTLDALVKPTWGRAIADRAHVSSPIRIERYEWPANLVQSSN